MGKSKSTSRRSKDVRLKPLTEHDMSVVSSHCAIHVSDWLYFVLIRSEFRTFIRVSGIGSEIIELSIYCLWTGDYSKTAFTFVANF